MLRLVQVVLDPQAPRERVAAFADYAAHDIDFTKWCDSVRAQIAGLYPAHKK